MSKTKSESKANEERAHARFSPSSASQWVNCPRSVELGEKVEAMFPETDSHYAAQGTLAHDLGEQMLIGYKLDRKNSITAKGVKIRGRSECDDEMRSYMEGYVEYCTDIIEDLKIPKKSILIEEKVSLEPWGIESCWGTADCIIPEPFVIMHVIDLKYGKGVAVSPENNLQLMLYALGALHLLDSQNQFCFEKVRLHIYQPRVSGGVSYWDISVASLKDFVPIFKEAVREATEIPDKETMPLSAGEHCKWCSAKPICPKLMQDSLTAISINPNIVKDQKELGKLLVLAKLVESWANSIWSLGQDQAKRGNIPANFKLVRGRKSRKWISDKAVVDEFGTDLGDELYTPPKIISPAALEKIVGTEQVSPFVEVIEGSRTLVHSSDKRKPVTPKENADAIFGDIS